MTNTDILNKLLNLKHPDDRIPLFMEIYSHPVAENEIFQIVSDVVVNNYELSANPIFHEEMESQFSSFKDKVVFNIAYLLNCDGEGFLKVQKALA